MILTERNSNCSREKLLAVAMILLAVYLSPGCASHSRTTVTKETATNPAVQTVVVEKETHAEEPRHGVVGSVFHVVGEVIAFPFQLVADVFRFIF